MKKIFGLISALFMLTACGTGGDITQYENTMKNQNNPVVTMQTNMGDIVLEIYEQEVPTIAGSFLTLAKEGKYDGTIFHRIIDGFMIQGGDYENRNGTGGAAANGGYLDDEIVPELSNIRGTISMANRGVTDCDALPPQFKSARPECDGKTGKVGTNGSQFFINQNPNGNTMLDGKHSVFGAVIGGMEIVDAIAKVATDNTDKPNSDVVIDSVLVEYLPA